MLTGHFLPRNTWRHIPGHTKDEETHPRSLDQAYFEFPWDLSKEQKFICNNCHYEDYISENAAFYYLVFGDFAHDEPAGFECPNCGGPMVSR